MKMMMEKNFLPTKLYNLFKYCSNIVIVPVKKFVVDKFFLIEDLIQVLL